MSTPFVLDSSALHPLPRPGAIRSEPERNPKPRNIEEINTVNRFLKTAFLCCALAALTTGASADEMSLFSLEGEVGRAQLQSMIADEVAEGHRIRIDPNTVRSNPGVLTFQLPDGRYFEAERTRFREYGVRWATWSGKVRQGRWGRSLPNYVFLTDHGDSVTGILNLGKEQYQIQGEGSDQRLLKLAAKRGHACGVEGKGRGGVDLVPPAWPEEASTDQRPVRSAASLGNAPATQTRVPKTRIDLLVVYPKAVSSWQEQVALIKSVQDSVGIANDIFDNSGINAEYNLVAVRRLLQTSQPTPSPTGSASRALDWLFDEPAEVRSLRTTYAADMVSLFIPKSWADTKACGIAVVPEAEVGETGPSSWLVSHEFNQHFSKRAFTAIRSGCGLNDFTLAHELGHNFGMRHANEEMHHEFPILRDYLFPYGRGDDTDPTFSPLASVMGCVDRTWPDGMDPAGSVAPICNREPRFSKRPWANRNNVGVANQQKGIFAGFYP